MTAQGWERVEDRAPEVQREEKREELPSRAPNQRRRDWPLLDAERKLALKQKAPLVDAS